MACCALAILLLSQLMLPIGKLMKLFGRTPVSMPDEAVAWSPQIKQEQPSTVSNPPIVRRAPITVPRFSARMLIALVIIEAGLFVMFLVGQNGSLAQIENTASGPMTMAVIEEKLHQSFCGQPPEMSP